jgi:hypothetical protein
VREDSPLDFALDAVAWSLFVAGGAFRWSATLYVGGKKNEQLSTSPKISEHSKGILAEIADAVSARVERALAKAA